MKVIKYIFGSILALLGIYLIVALFLPSEVEVSRSITIDRPANMVFQQVNSLDNWVKWDPWYESEPDMLISPDSEHDSGVGARRKWDSEEHGSGAQEIVESYPDSLIRIKLEMEKVGASYATWTFKEDNGKTNVTWTLEADAPLLLRPFMIMFLPSAVKKDYDRGLANLKKLVETDWVESFSDTLKTE